MSDNPIPLNAIVRAGVQQGANSDRIIHIAEQQADRRDWDAAERLRFRHKVAALIVQERKKR